MISLSKELKWDLKQIHNLAYASQHNLNLVQVYFICQNILLG